MQNRVSLTWWHLCLIVVGTILLGIGVTHIYYASKGVAEAAAKGEATIMVAVIVPIYAFFLVWLDKKFLSKIKKGDG